MEGHKKKSYLLLLLLFITVLLREEGLSFKKGTIAICRTFRKFRKILWNSTKFRKIFSSFESLGGVWLYEFKIHRVFLNLPQNLLLLRVCLFQVSKMLENKSRGGRAFPCFSMLSLERVYCVCFTPKNWLELISMYFLCLAPT